jgi:hypothetical protein
MAKVTTANAMKYKHLVRMGDSQSQQQWKLLISFTFRSFIARESAACTHWIGGLIDASAIPLPRHELGASNPPATLATEPLRKRYILYSAPQTHLGLFAYL